MCEASHVDTFRRSQRVKESRRGRVITVCLSESWLYRVRKYRNIYVIKIHLCINMFMRNKCARVREIWAPCATQEEWADKNRAWIKWGGCSPLRGNLLQQSNISLHTHTLIKYLAVKRSVDGRSLNISSSSNCSVWVIPRSTDSTLNYSHFISFLSASVTVCLDFLSFHVL